MERMVDHGFKANLKRGLQAIDAKLILCMLAIELGTFLMAVEKGIGEIYYPIVLIMMLFTIPGCLLVNLIGANKALFVMTLILLNLGFLVQQINQYESTQVYGFTKKIIISFGVAFITILLYSKFKMVLAKGSVLVGIMLLQIAIGVLMFVAGEMVGSSQGAIISWKGLTPFELVKVSYIFVAAGLLGEEERRAFRFLGRKVEGEIILMIHTFFILLILGACSELGTFMIIYMTGVVMLWIWGKKRKLINSLIFLSFIGFGILWLSSEKLLLPLLDNQVVTLPGAIAKIIRRFGTAIHPEKYMFGYGFQGTSGLQAISIGGWLGIPTERYRIDLPEATNDFVFANIIQTCGLLTGFLVVIFFFVMLRMGINIATHCKETYLQRVALAITFLIGIEVVVHIGYNIALFPITGIPLYFISQGFTAILTGMILIGILLEISIEK